MIPCKNIETIEESRIDGEIILLNIQTGRFNALSAVALAVWEAIDGVRSLEVIKGEMVARYDIDPAVCGKQIDAFVSELERAGLVVAR